MVSARQGADHQTPESASARGAARALLDGVRTKHILCQHLPADPLDTQQSDVAEARLPPKLRARLLARGIIKEEARLTQRQSPCLISCARSARDANTGVPPSVPEGVCVSRKVHTGVMAGQRFFASPLVLQV